MLDRMDTRSVIRSRRQSARLHRQPRDDKATKQSKSNRRVSDTDVSRAKTKAATPHPAISKATTIKRAHSATSPESKSALEPSVADKSSTKIGQRVASSPIFPNLAPTEDTRLDAAATQQHSDTALLRKPLAEASDNIGTVHRGSRVRARWVKTAQGAIRLVEDTHKESLGATTQTQETPSGGAFPLPGNRRRSARLAGSPQGEEETGMSATKADLKTTQPPTTDRKSADLTEASKEGLAPEIQCPPSAASPAYSSDSSLTDLDDLPSHNNLSCADGLDEELDFAENTPPIPELVADIARIVETSSPIAARSSQISTSNIATSTESAAVEATVPISLGPESAGITDIPNEAIDQADQASSSAQPMTPDPLPPSSNEGETSRGIDVPQTPENNTPPARATTPENAMASQHQIDSPRGVKRPAEEMSHDVQTPVRHQHVATSSRPFSFITPTRTVNLIESASSRDCYDVEGDELGSPGAGLWLDGQAGEAGPASELQEEPQLRFIIKCGDCGKSPHKFIVCATCLKTRYCGKYCQVWNWPIHRQSCQASSESNPDEVKRQEEYLESMWDGARRVLKETAVERNTATGGGKGEQAAIQAIVDSSFMGHRAGENIVEQGIRLLGGSGEGVAGEDGAGQQLRSLSSDEKTGDSVVAEALGDDAQYVEDNLSKLPPPTPESMFGSRATALRLAQAADV